jgi:hypothetical protein
MILALDLFTNTYPLNDGYSYKLFLALPPNPSTPKANNLI